MVEKMVPKHLMLKKVIDMLEVFLKIIEGSLIISDLSISMVTIIKHYGFHWESHVGLDFTELVLIIDEHVCDYMWMILLVIYNDIKKLFPKEIVWCFLVRLLDTEWLDRAIIVVFDDGLQVIDAFSC